LNRAIRDTEFPHPHRFSELFPNYPANSSGTPLPIRVAHAAIIEFANARGLGIAGNLGSTVQKDQEPGRARVFAQVT